SFVLTLAGFPPGASFVLAFPTLSDLFGPDFLGAFQVLAFAFPFPAVPTLSAFFRFADHFVCSHKTAHRCDREIELH
ncbi:hypothetical protein, partial [Streptomyces sp. NPDC051211]|uniref:hypothetical protein n=1 Tax=Streptomyces sp. NPDC051211 TaxID=3154643 RepID=UPI00344FD1DE